MAEGGLPPRYPTPGGPGYVDSKGLHLPKGVRIPLWTKYKVQDCPELESVQRRLAARGLKDPWLRNEVWRFDPKLWGTQTERLMVPFRGIHYGLIAAIATVLISNVFFKEEDHGHGHGHGHDEKYKLLHEM